MKKLLACGLILTMLSSTGVMCFAGIDDPVEVVSVGERENIAVKNLMDVVEDWLDDNLNSCREFFVSRGRIGARKLISDCKYLNILLYCLSGDVDYSNWLQKQVDKVVQGQEEEEEILAEIERLRNEFSGVSTNLDIEEQKKITKRFVLSAIREYEYAKQGSEYDGYDGAETIETLIVGSALLLLPKESSQFRKDFAPYERIENRCEFHNSVFDDGLDIDAMFDECVEELAEFSDQLALSMESQTDDEFPDFSMNPKNGVMSSIVNYRPVDTNDERMATALSMCDGYFRSESVYIDWDEDGRCVVTGKLSGDKMTFALSTKSQYFGD